MGSAVGSSVTGSIGSSVVGSAASGGNPLHQGSQNTAGDPLSLIFLVQGVAVTRKLRSAPRAYRKDFAGSLEVFNLKGIEPPAWAYSFVNAAFSDRAKASFVDNRRRASWYNRQTGKTTYECPCAASGSSLLRSTSSAGSWVFPAGQTSYYFSTAANFALPSTFTIETWIKPYSTSSDYSW
jgi:hypothetical protein